MPMTVRRSTRKVARRPCTGWDIRAYACLRGVQDMRQGTGSKRATKVGVLTTRLGSLLALISTFVFVFVTAIGGSASAAPSGPGYWLEAGDGGVFSFGAPFLSLIHISEPTRLGMISYAVFCL